jgi:uncharacterized protein (TIGR03118 family)
MRPATIAAVLLVIALPTSTPALAQRFTQTDLVSDVAGGAVGTDANLVNPWGLAPGASGVFWSANQGTGTSTLYDPDGTIRSLVVTIPGGSPTGIVATAAADSAFDVPNDTTTARAAFIFVSLGGTVSAWSPAVNQTNAIEVAVDSGAVYTGAALGGTAADPRLYVADFAGGSIVVYDSSFTDSSRAGAFVDPSLPSGYYPFNIANVNDELYVTYAQQDGSGRALPGDGLGIISVFDLNGNFLRRFATGGELDAPWAVVQAPAGFEPFGGDLLVGNFGDGRILAYDAASGAFQGALEDTLGSDIVLEGLWGLSFGLPVSGAEVANRLYFAAGIDGETHGLFGYLAVEDTTGGGPGPVACENHGRDLDSWHDECDDGGDGRHNNGRGHGWGHFPGHHPGGLPPGHDRDGDGRDDHGFGPQMSDELADLLDDVEDADAPNAFGEDGCFEATCELLDLDDGDTLEEAAQALLVTRLNLHSGAICDSFLVVCDGGPDSLDLVMLGDVADSLDVLLCEDGDEDVIEDLTEILVCVADGGDGVNDDGDDDDGDFVGDRRGRFAHKIRVKTTGMHPVRFAAGPATFALTATVPSMVRLRIYDVRGRLVAEPMSGTLVLGNASAQWDGRDLGGREVAPGTYFYRAFTGDDAANGRLLIVR